MPFAFADICIYICIFVCILVVLLATIICSEKLDISGGNIEEISDSEEDDRISIDTSHDNNHNSNAHDIGDALYKHAMEITDSDVIGREYIHSTPDSDTSGGAKISKKLWTDYATWHDLIKDKHAEKQYMIDRMAALDNLSYDWSDVMTQISPCLNDDREYIGLINYDRDKKKLYVVEMEASPTKIGADKNSAIFASVPAKLVAKISARPALFIWHTHPNDPRGSPLPSPADISTSIMMGFSNIYAASLVIGRYGIILYTINGSTHKRIWNSSSPGIAIRHLRYDAASFFSGMRSWKNWTLDDYRKAYDIYGLLYVIYPTSEYSSAQSLLSFQSDMTSETVTELLDDLKKSIIEYKKISKNTTKNASNNTNKRKK